MEEWDWWFRKTGWVVRLIHWWWARQQENVLDWRRGKWTWE